MKSITRLLAPAARIGIRLLAPVVIVGIGWLLFNTFSVEKPKPPRPQPEPRINKTRVIELNREDFPTIVRTQGVVRPHNEATVTSQVSGKVKTVSEKLHDGSFFSAGDVLLTLDEEDFEDAVTAAEANLARAKTSLSQEQARANQARRNWEDLGYEEEPNELVLRLPQLREAEANVDAAQSSLERAERDLKRTSVVAAFDGRVLERTVAVGQSITPGTSLATVFNTDVVEVRLPVTLADLKFINLPESTDQDPIEVKLIDQEFGYEWKAEVTGTEGALNPESRELFAIAMVKDPFSREVKEGDKKRPPLRIGQSVLAEINGRVLKDVMVIPRYTVRRLKQISLVSEEMTLDHREIEPIWSNEEYLVIKDPEIPDGSKLATTKLVYGPRASKIEIIEDPIEPPAETETASPNSEGTKDENSSSSSSKNT